jgi:hypothetical protein
MKDDLILPTQIPWGKLKGKDLEECLYWLIDSIGGKDLEWRLGGEGGGAPDQGRDLEAYFHMHEPDGEISRKKWWIEAKGRASTVEPAAVKEAILNATGKEDLDVLVIATNTTFSNPTRDWVKEWQKNHFKPIIRLWDKHNLERLLCQHPEVVIRLFVNALTPQGRLEVVRSRFWNYSSYSDGPTLEYLWQHRVKLEFDYSMSIAIIVSEIANGNIMNRPWTNGIDKNILLRIFGHGLVNLIFFCARASQAGTSENPYIQGLAFLLLIILDKFPIEKIYKHIIGIWDCLDTDLPYPKPLANMAISYVLLQLIEDIYEACTDDCRRIGPSAKIIEFDLFKRNESYWDRLKIEISDSNENKEIERFYYELKGIECKAGLKLDNNNKTCPLIQLKYKKDMHNIKPILSILKKIIHGRTRLMHKKDKLLESKL